MMIDNRTTQEALDVLNKQLQNKLKCTTLHDVEIQNAYYSGMKDMLSMILTENYSGDNEIDIHVTL